MNVSNKCFGKRRKWIGMVSVAFGLTTFFIPLIDTNPAVMGNLRWSVFDLLQRFDLEVLLNKAGGFVLSAAVIYVLLLVALVAMFVSPSQKFLGTIGVAGAAVTYLAFRFAGGDLERMLYGSLQDFRIPRFGITVTGRGVGIGQLMFLLLGVMLVIVFLSRSPSLDEP